MRYLKRQRPANLHTIEHRPPTWHHIRHDRKCERSAGELVFGDEARGLRPRSSRLSRRNSGVAGRGRDHTSGGHAGGRRREHRQPSILLAAIQCSVAHVAAPPAGGFCGLLGGVAQPLPHPSCRAGTPSHRSPLGWIAGTTFESPRQAVRPPDQRRPQAP